MLSMKQNDALTQGLLNIYGGMAYLETGDPHKCKEMLIKASALLLWIFDVQTDSTEILYGLHSLAVDKDARIIAVSEDIRCDEDEYF